ncbi:hypothetical protein HDV02_003221 [Globomyces sp. JEL0801]|nr:hypothetical protein HDV02_003221 [Globomyces sp. JEL0801]
MNHYHHYYGNPPQYNQINYPIQPFSLEPNHRHHKITLRNLSHHTIEVFVTNYTGGSDEWFVIHPNAEEQWHRTGWECLVVKESGNRVGIYLPEGSKVCYQGQGKQINHHLLQTHKMHHGVDFINNSCEHVDVFMSSYSGGTDEWFGVAPGNSEHWGRDGWDVLVVKRKNGERFGIYVHSGASIKYQGAI